MSNSRWMTLAWRLAALQNLFLGGFMILYPLAPFRWASLAPPRCPEIWQCLGMVLCVYGIGYAIAARDPLRHWPIVLVGLLGKVLGPARFLWGAVQDRLPWAAVWTLLPNVVVWLAPFGRIPKRAVGYQREVEDIVRAAAAAAASSASTLAKYRTQHGQDLAELAQLSPVLQVFLRPAGCTFCRKAVGDLARARTRLEQSGVRVVVVHQPSGAAMTRMLAARGLNSIDLIRDFDRHLYRTSGLRRGTPRQLRGLKVWWRGLWAALIRGHGAGKPDGDPFQMPGVVLLHSGRILRSYYHRSAAGRPDYEAFAVAGLRALAPA